MNKKRGLTDEEVIKSRKEHGSNIITNKKKNSFFKLFIETLGDPIIRILIIALGIKLVFLMKDFDWYETVGIVIAIFLASFISTISEYGSEKAFEKLQEEASKIKCKVRRNNNLVEIGIEEVVVGDILLLGTGDRVPADGVLICGELEVDESSLNGETKEVKKIPIKTGIVVEQKNSVFRGTVVYSKEAEVQVTKVGDQTFYGTLASELQEKSPDSPLKIRLRHLAELISKIGYIGAFLVSISYLFSVIVVKNNFDLVLIQETITNFPVMIGYILYALTLSVTIIVVAVPEGLPMMITLVLSSNMKRMLKDNVMVRKLVGIETAGSINILFTDKTGTLTNGKMEMLAFLGTDFKEYKSEKELKSFPQYYELIKKSIVYNNASSYTENKKEVIGGNITDRAILKFIKSEINNVQKIENLPFDSKNKYSKVTIKDKEEITLFKGAPEKILMYCNSYYDNNGTKKIMTNNKIFQSKIQNYTNKGYRLIAFATSKNRNLSNLTLVGFALIKDDVRKEAIEGVKLVKRAHIHTVMITGDNKDTAVAIGKEVGILDSPDDIILTSDELKLKTDEEIKLIIPKLKVVARSLPQDKSRLVRISEEIGLVVGMTGDGVNDAPALKKADVGFAMGSGTEVAKEASDIVILDDNFLSISKAILYGRTIFKSIRKFIIFQLTVNICAVSLSIIGPFIGVETPVTVIQMLWINMVMDTFASLAFAFEPPLEEYMNELPKKKDEQIMNRYMRDEIVFTGAYSSILCILFLKLPIISHIFRDGQNNEYLLSAFFGLFIFMGIFNCFNARTHRLNLIANILKNKIFILIILFIVIVQILLIYYGGSLFRTVGLTSKEFYVMVLLAFTVIPVDWIRKLILRTRGLKGGV